MEEDTIEPDGQLNLAKVTFEEDEHAVTLQAAGDASSFDSDEEAEVFQSEHTTESDEEVIITAEEEVEEMEDSGPEDTEDDGDAGRQTERSRDRPKLARKCSKQRQVT